MRSRLLALAALAAVGVLSMTGGAATAASPFHTSVVYDNFEAAGGYTLSTYNAKWGNPYGMIDMGTVCPDGVTPANGDTRSFAGGVFSIDDAPFSCGADFSVFDHLKYIAISNQAFVVPANGSLTFSSDIKALTPGTQVGRVIHGTYGPPGSYPSGAPWSAVALQGQQAGAVMNMVNFQTGQLFDWFVSGNTAFALVERLPTAVTGSPGSGPNEMYTQIITEFAITPGVAHNVAITYTRGTGNGTSTVEFFFDGTRVAKVKHVGVPIDRQPGQQYTGIYPSYGPGEDLRTQLDSFQFGHGTFSLLDAFPFQWGWGFTGCDPLWPAICADSVSVPLSERLFGQGVEATFDNFTATTITNG